ncbi:SPT3 Dosage dependent suppressor of Ty-induced promoter mutations-like protein, partial [Coemansia erecta]
YERASGSAAYANHALSGLNSPMGARQSLSTRNSPTLRPHAYAYGAHGLFDAYSQFASAAGTPSLGNTPHASPMLAAAHMGGFDTPFHLPPQSLALGTYAQDLPISPIYGAMHPVHAQTPGSALGLQHAHFDAGLMSQLGAPAEPVQIGQLLPTHGPATGGVYVIISGHGFHPNVEVYFGAAKAAGVQVKSPTEILCVLPPSRVRGQVPLRVGDSAARTVFDVPSCAFRYDEDADRAMVELGLHILGVGKDGELPPRVSQDARLAAVAQALFASLAGGVSLVDMEKLMRDALHLAVDCGAVEPRQLAQRHESSSRTLMHFAAYLGMCSLLSTLTQLGAAVDECDQNSMTPLHFGCLVGRSDVVELLLNAGAPTAARSSAMQTPADVARAQGNAPLAAMIENNDTYLSYIEDGQTAASAAAPSMASIASGYSAAVPWSAQVSDASFVMPSGMFAQQSAADSRMSDQLLASNPLFSPSQQFYEPPKQG